MIRAGSLAAQIGLEAGAGLAEVVQEAECARELVAAEGGREGAGHRCDLAEVARQRLPRVRRTIRAGVGVKNIRHAVLPYRERTPRAV